MAKLVLNTKNALVTEIRDIFSKPPDGTFDFIGKFRWVEKARNFFFCGTLKKEHYACVQRVGRPSAGGSKNNIFISKIRFSLWIMIVNTSIN